MEKEKEKGWKVGQIMWDIFDGENGVQGDRFDSKEECFKFLDEHPSEYEDYFEDSEERWLYIFEIRERYKHNGIIDQMLSLLEEEMFEEFRADSLGITEAFKNELWKFMSDRLDLPVAYLDHIGYYNPVTHKFEEAGVGHRVS